MGRYRNIAIDIDFDIERIKKFIDDKNEKARAEYEKVKGDTMMQERKLLYSNCDFAYDAGINRNTFLGVINRNVKPGVPVLYKIAKHMECKMEDLLIIK